MRHSSRTVTGLVIALLIILTGQGWTGDFVNLFAIFPIGPVKHTISGFSQAIAGAGRTEVTHAMLGMVLAILAILILVMAFHSGASKAVLIWTVIGLVGVLSAAFGGIFFVLSGFQNNGNSAQMGGSFIGTYASYFLVLYFNAR